MTSVAVHGLAPMQGDTAFAFCVLRFHQPIAREALVEVLRYLASLLPDVDSVVDELLPADLEQAVQLIAVPWLVPEAGHGLSAQRRLIEAAGSHGVEAAWFFQTGTSLPTAEDEDDDDTDDATATHPIDLIDESSLTEDDDEDEDEEEDAEEDDEEEDDEDVRWSFGPPPQVDGTRFPVDGYPDIIEEFDWEDFGIAVKLAGDMAAGEGTVLLGFHTLWLAPYGGRYRNTAVTIDRTHHAAHLWVDRFAVPVPPEVLVGHLLWILSKLDEVVPIVHARFEAATMAQKYGGLMGDTGEPFVLGGNPLLAVHAQGGEGAVDAWIAKQNTWSNEEIVPMLRELAIEIVTSDGDVEEEESEEEVEEIENEETAAEEQEEAQEGEEEAEERGRQIATYAGELLRARAARGNLDPRVAERLTPLLGVSDKFEQRRCAVVEILGAQRHEPAVAPLVQLLLTTTVDLTPDAIGREELVIATAKALGAIGDPAAIGALSSVVAASGSQNDEPRAAAADALAACLAATPEPRSLDGTVLDQLLATIRERNDGELNAETHFAYGRLVRLLPADRRAAARKQLAETDTARDDAVAMLARQAALALASPTTDIDAPPRDLASLLHEVLTSLDYDHEYTVRNLRVALEVAELVPDVVDPDDLVWLTTFHEADIRSRAHALLAACGKPLAEAPVFDRYSVRDLGDRDVVRLIGETRVVGRAALVGEAGKRGLVAAKRAIIDACHDAIGRARRGGENLLDPDTRLLEAAVPVLRRPPYDDQVIALFDRMLRHSNYHVKWELLQKPPRDERLIGAMFQVLGEKWGWQETAAKEWLIHFQGTPAYEDERKRASTTQTEHSDDRGVPDHGDDLIADDDDDLPDDEEIN